MLLVLLLQVFAVSALNPQLMVVDDWKCFRHVTAELNLSLLPAITRSNYRLYFGERNYCIMHAKSSNYLEIIDDLRRERYWNSRGRLLLSFDDHAEQVNLKNVFERLSQTYIYNAIVYSNGELFTYFPYKYGNINLPHLDPYPFANCTGEDYFPEKLPDDFSNTTVNVAYVYVNLYAMCTDCFPRGIEFEIMDIVKERLALEFVYLQQYSNWGRSDATGTYDNAYGAIQNGTAQIGIGTFQIDNRSIDDFDHTYPYMIDRLVFVIPRRNATREKIMLDGNVWLIVIVSYLTISLLLYASDTNDIDLPTVYLLTYRTSLGNWTSRAPRRPFGRVILLLWSISCWILTIDVQSYLMYFLTQQGRAVRTIDDLYGLAQSDLKIGLYVHLRETFRVGRSFYERTIYEKSLPCNVNDECMRSMLDRGDMAIVRPFRTIRYEISSKYLDGDGVPRLQIVGQSIVMRYVAVCLRKDHPLFVPVQILLDRIKNSGFVDYWNDWYINYVNIVHNKHVPRTNDLASKALNFHHLDGILKLLMYGLSFATIVFFVELLTFKYARKNALWLRFRELKRSLKQKRTR